MPFNMLRLVQEAKKHTQNTLNHIDITSVTIFLNPYNYFRCSVIREFIDKIFAAICV